MKRSMRVITGCPRSGTSFVCQIAQALGADFGNESDLIAGNRWNRNGYFENRKLNILNHRLMFGRWSNPAWWVDTIWEDNFWSYSRKIASLCLAPIVCQKELICKRGHAARNDMSVIGNQLNNKTVKDPRFCQVLDAWLQTDEIESILFVVRHPWEVARSLSAQTGLPSWLTNRAWFNAVDRFLQATGETNFFVVDFNLLHGENWKSEIEMVLRFLGMDSSSGSFDSLANVYNPNHQTFRASEIELPDSINERYRKLKAKQN